MAGIPTFAYVGWIDHALSGAVSWLEPAEPWHFGLIAPYPVGRQGEEDLFAVVLGVDRYNLTVENDGMGGDTGPALHLLVGAGALKSFRDEIARDLESR